MRISKKLLLVLSSFTLLAGCVESKEQKEDCQTCPQCSQCETCKECEECEECKECEECPIPHEHTFSEAWEKDETNHWHKATCEHKELTSNLAPHNYGDDNVCDDCGYIKVVTESVTVSFDSCGGSSIESVVIEKGKAFIKPNDPTKENYIFMGWFDNADYFGKAYEFGSKVDENLTLYACWGVKVTLVNYGGAVLLDTVVRADSKMEEPLDPTYLTAHFDGWFDNESYLGDKFDFDSEITKDLTLYAKYYYEVTFLDANKDEYSFQKVALGEKVIQPEKPSIDYHEFDKWYIDEKCVYEFNFENILKSDVTLYANFIPSSYSIIYNGATMLTHQNPSTYTYGVGLEKFEEPTEVQDGYKFYGWYFDENFEVEATSISSELHEIVNVYAKVAQEYDISYVNWPEGDTNPNPTKYTQYDEFDIDFSDVTLPTGIKDVSIKINEVATSKVSKGTTGNLEIELVFNAITTKITFNPNNLYPIFEITINYGETLVVADPSREEHTFLGWYDLNDKKYESGSIWTCEEEEIYLSARFAYDLVGGLVWELIDLHDSLHKKADNLEYVHFETEHYLDEMYKVRQEGYEVIGSTGLNKEEAYEALNFYKEKLFNIFDQLNNINVENARLHFNGEVEAFANSLNALLFEKLDNETFNKFSLEILGVVHYAEVDMENASSIEEFVSIYEQAKIDMQEIYLSY